MVNRSVLVLTTSLAAAVATGARGAIRHRELSDSDRVRSHLEDRRRRAQHSVGVRRARRKRPDPSADDDDRAAGKKCSFCSGGVPDPSLVLPGSPSPDDEVTCGQVKAFAETLEREDGLCGTAARGEAICCPAGEAEDGEDAGDIVDLGAADGNLSTLVAAVEAAGLVDTLKGEGPFTLFGEWHKQDSNANSSVI